MGGTPHTVIVGAGPAGASLAYLLASRGARVTLLERQTDFAREFRGEALMPSGIDALHQMGLQSALEDVPQSLVEAVEVYRNGKRLFRAGFDAERLGLPGILIVSQPAMLEMLVREAGRHPGFRLERGATVRDLLWENERVAGVRVQLPDGVRDVQADLVVGADGRASVVRRRAGLHEERSPLIVDIVWFKLPLPDAFREAPPLRVYIGRGHLLLAFRAYDGLLQTAWVIRKGTFGELRRRGIEEWVREMAEHVSPDLADHLRTHGSEVTRPFLLDAVSDRLVRWTAPGLLMLGDAAHPMSPVGAQGINIALRDSIVAANRLIPVVARSGPSPSEIDEAAKSVQRERLPEVATIQRMQSLPPPVVLGEAWWAGLALRVAPFLLRLDIARGRRGSVFRRFAFGTTEVRLDV